MRAIYLRPITASLECQVIPNNPTPSSLLTSTWHQNLL